MQKSTVIDDILSAFFLPRLAAGDRVCVALSGGRDSVALLHAMARLKASGALSFSLSALHVHHGLSPNADPWAEFCRAFCESLDVPLSVSRVQVPHDSGEGLEGAARRARYAAFSACAADWMVLGHHQDDQAETVLLNLLRGAGVNGLAGMPAERPARKTPDGKRAPVFLRPLLDTPRAVIEAYAQREGLSWVDDDSNADTRFRRNFLRHAMMPPLEAVFPGARRSLARAARHFAESAALLDERAHADYEKLATPNARISLSGWKRLSVPRAKNLLRFLWKAAGFSAPDTSWLDEAFRQLASASETLCVSTAEGELRVYRDEVYVLPRRPPPREAAVACPLDAMKTWAKINETRPWAGGRIHFSLAKGRGLRVSALEGKTPEDVPVFQALQGGERLKPHPLRPRKSLGKLFQEADIPPWERPRIPSLRVRGQLAWVGSLGFASEFSCAAEEEGLLLLWVP